AADARRRTLGQERRVGVRVRIALDLPVRGHVAAAAVFASAGDVAVGSRPVAGAVRALDRVADLAARRLRLPGLFAWPLPVAALGRLLLGGLRLPLLALLAARPFLGAARFRAGRPSLGGVLGFELLLRFLRVVEV